MNIVELTRETWPELETLFSANKTVGGRWCVWFLRSQLGAPLGLLALDDATPVGWVAVAPRRALVRKELS